MLCLNVFRLIVLKAEFATRGFLGSPKIQHGSQVSFNSGEVEADLQKLFLTIPRILSFSFTKHYFLSPFPSPFPYPSGTAHPVTVAPDMNHSDAQSCSRKVFLRTLDTPLLYDCDLLFFQGAYGRTYSTSRPYNP